MLIPGFAAGTLSAQVIDVDAGSSSLFDAQGGSVAVRGETYSASMGGGMVSGRLVGGAQLVKRMDSTVVTAGSDNVTFDLATDVFDRDHYLTTIGVGARWRGASGDAYVFGGASSTTFNSPFFDGAQAERPAALLFLHKQLGERWIAGSMSMISSKMTSIFSLAWERGDGTRVAVAGGVGANRGYGAGSFEMKRRWLEVKAAYIRAGEGFRRADVKVPLSSEPDRENVLVSVRPRKNLSFSFGRQNYLNPVYGSKDNFRSEVNQVSGYLTLDGIAFSAMAFESSYDGDRNIATVYAASRTFADRVRLQASYFASRPEKGTPTSTFLGSFQETVSPRWSLSQVMTSSGGQTNVGFGGSFLSNIATISADYQTYYVPAHAGAPFQQSLILNVQIHLLGNVTLTGGSFVSPNGRLLYTTEAEGIASAGRSVLQRRQQLSVGNVVLRGRVVDANGQGVAGAALLIDSVAVYTDSDGFFSIRERRSQAHVLTVLPDQFLSGQRYRVIAAPHVVRSSGEGSPGEVVVVLASATAPATGLR